jgi:ATP-dependent helicase/DNAse subunit B
MNIEHISVSRSQVWGTCQQQYKFKYHLKIDPTEPTPPYFTFGKMVHRIIEEHTLARGERDINEIQKGVLWGDILLEEESEIVPGKDLPPEYLKKLPAMIKAYLKLAKRIGFDGDCEWEFKYDLDPPNSKCVKGFIDRLIQKKDKYIIIDYKTTRKGRSQWRKTKRDIIGDLQLQCYAMAVMREFNVDPSKIYAALYYLDGEEFLGAQFSEKTLLASQEKLLKIYNRIEQTDPVKVWGRTGQHCRRCDFRTICPFYSVTG